MTLQSHFYDVFSPIYKGKPLETLFSTPDSVLHRRLRLGISSKFSAIGIRDFEPAINRTISIFLAKMKALEGQIISAPQWVEYFTFDLTAETMFDANWGFMEKERDRKNMIGGLPPGFVYGALVGQVPQLHRWLLGSRRFLNLLSLLGLPNPTTDIIEVRVLTLQIFHDTDKKM